MKDKTKQTNLENNHKMSTMQKFLRNFKKQGRVPFSCSMVNRDAHKPDTTRLIIVHKLLQEDPGELPYCAYRGVESVFLGD